MLRRLLCVTLLLVCSVAQAEQSCPKTFSSFIARFESSAEFQRLHTRFPLSYSFLDGSAEPDPKEVKVMVSQASAAKYPGIIFPSKATQASVPLKRKLLRHPSGTQVVHFDKPESDVYSVSFHFTQTVDCWLLVKVEDTSL